MLDPAAVIHDFHVSVTYNGEPFSFDNVRIEFEKSGDVVRYEVFLNDIKTGGGGHGHASASSIAELISQLNIIPSNPMPHEPMIGTRYNVRISMCGIVVDYTWHVELPNSWDAVGSIANKLIDWSNGL